MNYSIKGIIDQVLALKEGLVGLMSASTAVAPALERVMGSTMKIPTTQGPAHSAAATRDFEQAKRQEYMGAFESAQRQGPIQLGVATPGAPYSVSGGGELLKNLGTEKEPMWTATGANTAWYDAQRKGQSDLFARFHGAGPLKIDNYGAKDIFRTESLAKQSEGLAATLERQAKVYEKNEPGSAKAGVASDTAGLLRSSKVEIESALASYTQARLEPNSLAKQEQATERMSVAMARLDKTIADANEIAKQGPAAGGGGGLLGRITKEGMLATAGVAAAAYMGYRHTQDATAAAVLGADMGTFANQSQLRAGQLSREANYYANVNTAEGMMRNRGDILLRDPSFLGSKGLESTSKESFKRERDRLDLVESQRNTSAIGSMITGAMTGAVSGAVLGGVPTAGFGAIPGAVVGAFGGALAGRISANSAYIGSEATAISGELGKSAQNRALTQSALNIQAGAEALREQDLATKQRETMGLGVMMEMQAAQYQGARSVGSAAMTKNRMMELTTAGRAGRQYDYTIDPSGVGTLDRDATFQANLSNRSVFAENQISQTEFMGTYNAMMGVMGGAVRGGGPVDQKTGLTRLEAQAMGLNTLDRAGLGSAQENIANMAALNKVTGSQNSYKDLEGILGNAVAAGFDRSRMSQNFVRAATDLVQAVGATSTGYVSGALSRDSGLFSTTGVANELSLAQAGVAMQKYANITSGGGLIGVAKNIGAMAAGSTIATGLGAQSDLNNVNAMSLIKELESGGGGAVSDITTMDRVRATMKSKGISMKDAKKQVAKEMRAGVQASDRAIQTATEMVGGKGDLVRAQREKIRASTAKKGSKEMNEMVRDLLAYAGAAGSATTYGAEAAKQAEITELVLGGKITTGGGAKALADSKAKGIEATKDPVRQSLQAFLDATVRTAEGEFKGVTLKEYKDFTKNNFGASRVKTRDGRDLDVGEMERIEGKKENERTMEERTYLREGNRALKEKDRTDMAREASIKMREVTTTPKVFIENWDGLKLILGPQLGGERDNKG